MGIKPGVKMEHKTEPLYRKEGRKYVPVHARWYEDYKTDQMKTGTFRLVYAFSDGGGMYEYDVTPATAPMIAAMMIAKKTMQDEIMELSKMRPSGNTKYTKKQLAAIDRFRAEMGGMYPSWWTENCHYKIADAAIKAVLEYKP